MPIKLTYFDIPGAAEKVRLALVVSGTEFEDNRIQREAWPELKPKTPWGQVPILEVDGKVLTQSYAMLRWAGKLGDGSLYPAEKALEIDEAIGVHEDLARAMMPALFVGMRPEALGHAFANDEEKVAKVKAMRESFGATDLPKFFGFFSTILEKSGGPFFCGDKVTIADLAILPQVRHLSSGTLDHVPANVIDSYPTLLKWREAIMEVPQIKEWYSTH